MHHLRLVEEDGLEPPLVIRMTVLSLKLLSQVIMVLQIKLSVNRF
jgi:hypothetical protein